MLVMTVVVWTLRNSSRSLDAVGIGGEVVTALSTLFVAVLLFMIWQFIQTLRTAVREWPTAPSIEMRNWNLRGSLHAALTEPPKDVTPAYRWGMLAVILALLAVNIMWVLNSRVSSHGAGYSNFVVVLMLLLNHVSGSFRFPRALTLALRVLAWGWVVVGVAYICLLWE